MGYLTVPDGLTFNVLRRANRKRQGSVYKDADWSPCDWMTALAGEVGEAANVIKKMRRGDLSLDEGRAMVAKELADVQTYLDLLANALDINLAQATIAKFNEVSERINSPVFIDEDGSDWRLREGAEG